MDIRCTTCGEPWDTDTIHEIAEDQEVPYDEALALFRKHGCMVLGTKHAEVDEHAAEIARIAFELGGDDIDGIASDLQDAEFMGLL